MVRGAEWKGSGFLQARRRGDTIEARTAASVAGGACLAHLEEHRVLVAIDADFVDMLFVAGRVALAPERLARARPVDRAAGVDGELQRLCIHPRQHQHFAGIVLLRDGGKEPRIITLEALCDLWVKRGVGGRHAPIVPVGRRK